MKKYLTILSSLILICTAALATENYLVITSDQVSVSSEGLFVNIEGYQIPVDSLNIANNGYIVAIPSPQAAICPRCRKDTYTPGRACSNCGFPITNKYKE